MPQSRLQVAVFSALAGIYAVYALIVIARVGYETGQVLAGTISIGEAWARLDVSSALFVLGGIAVIAALRKTTRS